MVLSLVLTTCGVIGTGQSEYKEIQITNVTLKELDKEGIALLIGLFPDELMQTLLTEGLANKETFTYEMMQEAENGSIAYSITHAEDGTVRDKLYTKTLSYWLDGGSFWVVLGTFKDNIDMLETYKPEILSLAISKNPFSFDAGITYLDFSLDFLVTDAESVIPGLSLR